MGKIKQKTKKFIYKNFVKWNSERRGLLLSAGKPDIEVSTPPEFRGHAGIWTPEDLFVASINSCIMTTFLYYAERESLEFLSYESQAEGILERVGNQFMFSEVIVKPHILIKRSSDIQKAKDVIGVSEKNCLISNSVKSKVKLLPEIKTEFEKED